MRNTIVAYLLRVLQSTVKSKKRQASTFAEEKVNVARQGSDPKEISSLLKKEILLSEKTHTTKGVSFAMKRAP